MSKLPWKSRRLTNNMRDEITQRFRKKLAEAEPAKRLIEREHKLAIEVYSRAIPGDIQLKMASFPKGYFYEQRNVRVRIRLLGSGSSYVDLQKKTGTFLMPANAHYSDLLELDQARNEDQDLIERVLAWDADYTKFTRECRAISRQFRAMLNQYRTEAQLVEDNPEVVQYMLPPQHVPAKNPPAIRYEDIKAKMEALSC
jgi:hypothetical protein